MDVTEPLEGPTVEGLPLRLSERIALAASDVGEPRITVHDDGTMEIELDVYAILDTALPRLDVRIGMVRRISRRLSGRGRPPARVRHVTRRP